jgi:hypothetical protein
MSDLEKATESGGSLLVRIGDALSPSATVEGGFAGEQLTSCEWNTYFALVWTVSVSTQFDFLLLT